MTDPSRLERFSAGEHFAVHPDAIERELSSLWRAAGKSTDEKHPVTRACLWNVVVHVEERPARSAGCDPESLVRMINDLPRFLAARALVLRTRDAEEGKDELESWISANCILAGDGGKLVCSEEITLASRSEGERHLPGLVRALLVPGVPTAVVFGNTPDPDAPMVKALALAADRVIIASDRCVGIDPLPRVAKLAKMAPLSAMDLGWLETSAMRRELAAIFDPPRPATDVEAIERVEVVAAPGDAATARLFLAWIGSSLGGTRPEKVGNGSWKLKKASGELRLCLDIETGAALGITLSGHKLPAPCAVESHRDTHTIDISSPEGAIDHKPLKERRAAAVLSRALTTRSHDRSFQRALSLAVELV